jgi:3-oxoacyl-[acyl-carrier-protein] synthase III
MKKYAEIVATEYYLPDGRLNNNDLSSIYPGWSSEKIYQKTGIASRAIASDAECASDLGVAAAEKLFEHHDIDRSTIDYLIFCTQSPDYFLPTTACLVQDRLKISKTSGAIDINQGCSGFVYGLGLAKALIETGQASSVLLITAETYSKFIHPKDKSVRTIFGDAAAATFICASSTTESMLGFAYGSDGSGGQNLIVPSGGTRRPKSLETQVEHSDSSGNVRSDDNLFMNGSEIFSFTLDVIPKTLERILSSSGLAVESVDHFLFHQANRFMLDHIQKKLNIPTEKFMIDMEDCGNTVSSTIPILINRMKAENQLVKGEISLLMGFGVGYSWAGCIIRW